MTENKSDKEVKRKTVSVIILNYNGKSLLAECLDAVQKQSVLADEIVVLDNASTDGSVDFMEKNYKDVVIVKNKTNDGTSQGSNVAASHAKGDYFIFMSNDIVMDKDCIKYLLETVENDEKVGICTSVLVNYCKDGE